MNILQFFDFFFNLMCLYTTRIPEMLGRFLNLNKMKTKRYFKLFCLQTVLKRRGDATPW